MKYTPARSPQHPRTSLRQTLLTSYGALTIALFLGCPAKQVPPPTLPLAPPKQTRYALPSPPRYAPSRGPRNAPLQLLELLNPTHPQTRKLHRLRAAVWRAFPGTVRWTVRFNPHIGKDHGYFLSRSMLVAQLQSSFWTYNDRMMRLPNPPTTLPALRKLAARIGIHAQIFELGMRNPTLKRAIDQDMRLAHRMGLSGKARLFLNGIPLPPPYTQKGLLTALKEERLRIQSLLKPGTPPDALASMLTKGARPMPPRRPVPNAIRPRAYVRVPPAFYEQVPIKGPGDAPIQLIEFSDFTCAPCRQAYFQLRLLLRSYPKSIQLFFKIYPIGTHRESYRAAELAAAAQDRQRFWTTYDLLFQQQRQVFKGNLLDIAVKAGFQRAWIAGELDRKSFRRRILRNQQHGQQLRITAVPTLILNGLILQGMPPPQVLQNILHIELWKAGHPRKP